MKSKIILSAIPILFIFSFLHAQQYENAGADYSESLLSKPGEARIQAFEKYIQNYPDTTKNMFTKLAYYWLAYDYYSIDNFRDAIKYGEKYISFSGMGEKLEASTYLILAYSYGNQGSPLFSQENALRNVDKALVVAKKNDLENLALDAQNLKNELIKYDSIKSIESTPTPNTSIADSTKTQSPVQKLEQSSSEINATKSRISQIHSLMRPKIDSVDINSILNNSNVMRITDVQKPRKIKEVKPVYPQIALTARIQGVVEIEAMTDIYGRVRQARVISGHPLLNDAALSAIKQWVYEPYILNGIPKPVIFTATATFTLQNQ